MDLFYGLEEHYSSNIAETASEGSSTGERHNGAVNEKTRYIMHKYLLTTTLLFTLSFITTCKGTAPDKIVIGALFDITGKTSDVGVDYSWGVRDYIRHVNEKGGINGRQIQLLWKDYAYALPKAHMYYEELKKQKVIAIIGWGTGDTEALSPKIKADRIPYISASYSNKLANGTEYPFNFIGAVSYSDQVRIALKYIQTQKKDARIALIYNNTGFGKSPMMDAKIFAKKNGINIAREIIVPLDGQGATEKMADLKEIDWGIVQQTSTAAVAVANAVADLKLNTKLIMLNWGLDENVVQKLKKTDNIYGTIPYGVWDDDLPGIKLLHEINAKYHPDVPKRSCRYVQGYISARIVLEAIRLAGSDLNGERIKEELEGLNEFDTGASFNKVSFSKRVHKPSMRLKLYGIRNRKLVPLSEMIYLDRKVYGEL